MGALAGRKIGLLTASASRLGGGVFEAVVTHARLLHRLGAEPVVFALDDAFASEDRRRFGEIGVHHARVLGPAQVGYAPQLVPALLGARLDALHLHGIWMYPSHAGLQWARRAGSERPYVISPHGMLDPWITGRGRVKKALARLGYERASWRAAAAFHALTTTERADIRRETGCVESAVVVIPNAAPVSADGGRPTPRESLLYIGRIHSKKNLAALIDAFAVISPRHPQARLDIAGWGGEEDVAALRSRIDALAQPVRDRARFHGPAYGEDKTRLLGAARAVVLPSFSEGLPMAVLEAWAAGVPTVMTADCNLPEGFAAGAAIQCGHAPAQVVEALDALLGLDQTGWNAMAAAAQALVRRTFSAEAVADAWSKTYRGLTGGGPLAA